MDNSPGTALILGVDGQDGSYLAELLLSKQYRVIGWVPDIHNLNVDNLSNIIHQIQLVQGSLLEKEGLIRYLKEFEPDEVYNLASPSYVGGSWKMAEEIGEVTGVGVLRILEAIRLTIPTTRFFQASSSEIFGDPVISPQNELTPINPRNPYGIAKSYAHLMTRAFREQYRLFAVCGILYNHESPRRPIHFVTRKITDGAVKIALGRKDSLYLGDLDARRDWSFAGDVVRAMWMMLQTPDPVDYVIGSGTTYSVRELCEIVFNYLEMDYSYFVRVDEKFIRPRERKQLCADPGLIFRDLGWKNEVAFREMIYQMIIADQERLTRGE